MGVVSETELERDPESANAMNLTPVNCVENALITTFQ